MQIFGKSQLIFILSFFILFAYSQSDKSPSDLVVAPVVADNSEIHISIIDSILNFSKQYLGRPYRGGGKGPNSFDCSGFTSFVFSNFGIKLGSSSGDQAEQLPSIAKEDIQPGDLVFFNGHRRGSRVGHVGLVVSKHENGSYDFIHSASSVGISISHSESDYYNRRYVKAGRVFTTDSLVASYIYNKKSINSDVPIVKQPELCENEKPVETIVKKVIPAKYHTVKSGETLSSIANKYGLTVTQLKKNNQLNGDFLSLKQRLKIKEKQEVEVVEKQKLIERQIVKVDSVKNGLMNIESERAELTTEFHNVAKGETLYSISKKYGVKVKDLIKINNLKTESVLAGQSIKLKDNVKLDLAQEIKIRESEENESTDSIFTNEKNYGTHIVSKGETLQSISKQYGLTIAAFKELNNLNTDKILAGQKLIAPTNVIISSKKINAKQKSKTHTVKSGETLSEIAEKYHCTVRELKAWNNKNNNKLSLGEKLKIIN